MIKSTVLSTWAALTGVVCVCCILFTCVLAGHVSLSTEALTTSFELSGPISRGEAEMRVSNPLVVIHGVGGSRLVDSKTNETVWGMFGGSFADPATPSGARALALPMGDPPGCDDLQATGPLKRVTATVRKSVLLFHVEATTNHSLYLGMYESLAAAGYLDQVFQYKSGETDVTRLFRIGLTIGRPSTPSPATANLVSDTWRRSQCISYFYDWRRDNVENAILFGQFLQEKRTCIQEATRKEIGELRSTDDSAKLALAERLQTWLDAGIRFDVVAHSMGGLIARYYLRYGSSDLPMEGELPRVTWAGASDIDRMILIGTPHFGSAKALRDLIEGYRPTEELEIVYPPAVVGSMPAAFQLLPRAWSVSGGDMFDADQWAASGWGLMDPNRPELAWLDESHATAYRHLQWCLSRAHRFQQALDQVPPDHPSTRIYLVFGCGEETVEHLTLQSDGQGPALLCRMGDGDGTVPVASASACASGQPRPFVPTKVYPLKAKHLELTSHPDLVGILREVLDEPDP